MHTERCTHILHMHTERHTLHTHTHTKKTLHTHQWLSELTRSKASSKYMFIWRHRKECDAIVWLHFYDCLNTMFSQHILTLWSLLKRLSQWLSEPTRNKTSSKYMLTFTLTYKHMTHGKQSCIVIYFAHEVNTFSHREKIIIRIGWRWKSHDLVKLLKSIPIHL